MSLQALAALLLCYATMLSVYGTSQIRAQLSRQMMQFLESELEA
jgi:hypothetical protein